MINIHQSIVRRISMRSAQRDLMLRFALTLLALAVAARISW